MEENFCRVRFLYIYIYPKICMNSGENGIQHIHIPVSKVNSDK